MIMIINKTIATVSAIQDGVQVDTTMDCDLLYDPVNDPVAVCIHIGGQPWHFARDLLIFSSTHHGGDVTVEFEDGAVHIRLSSPDGAVWVALPAKDVDAFVAKTLVAVPPGEERYDVDEWLRQAGVA